MDLSKPAATTLLQQQQLSIHPASVQLSEHMPHDLTISFHCDALRVSLKITDLGLINTAILSASNAAKHQIGIPDWVRGRPRLEATGLLLLRG